MRALTEALIMGMYMYVPCVLYTDVLVMGQSGGNNNEVDRGKS